MQERENQFWFRFVEKQLQYRYLILGIMTILTLVFAANVFFKLKVVTNFFDLYPPKHEYIQLYKEFRKMFGSANVLTIILERTDGEEIYHPETLGKLDTLTRGLLEIKGVNPLQVVSAVHPKVKQVITGSAGIGIFPLTHPSPGYPKNEKDAQAFRKRVYSNAGIRGFYISLDDKSAVVYAGLWEEGLDFGYLFKAINDLVSKVEDGKHICHVSGYPMLYAWMDYYKTQLLMVLMITIMAIVITLGVYFRSIRGVLIPLISGGVSAIWGLGFAGLAGFNIDPLLLVVPILLSARALSHSCQCMDRYHQEFAVLLNKRKAIIVAYSEVFAPCMAGAVTDGLGCLTIAFASIPLMQKLAYISSFWVISILVAVTLLNPIILYFLPTPDIEDKVKVRNWLGKKKLSRWNLAYQKTMELLVKLSGPRLKWVAVTIIVLLALPGAYTATHLKIGDSSAGGAILYPDHPYNVAAGKINEKFVGGSRLVVVVKGKEKGAIKNAHTLQVMDQLGNYIKNNIPNVGGTMCLTDLVRRINRLYHDGSPKWEIVPDNPQHLGAIYFMLASNMAPGEMDQFVSLPDYTHSNVTAFFRNYNHATIKSAISETRKFADQVNSDPDSKIEIKLAGGILGILAAVNEEVEWSYWAIFIIIFSTVFFICLLTYRSIKAALILIIPVFVAQVLCDLFMMLNHIDLNIDSLPVASVGVGVGIDYGIYLMSRLREECGKTDDFEKAKLIALTTTGKTIMFTALTIAVALIPWLFSSLKFQAEMGILILFLMIFNMIGALVFVPALSAVLKPNFVKNMATLQPDPAGVEMADDFSRGHRATIPKPDSAGVEIAGAWWWARPIQAGVMLYCSQTITQNAKGGIIA